MRRLRIVVQTANGALPLVVAASVLTAEACGQSETGDPGGLPTGMQGGSAAGGQGGTLGGRSMGGAISLGGSGGTIVVPGEAGMGGAQGACDPDCSEFHVELPEEGVPAEPGQICAASVTPVNSNRAALIDFLSYDANGAFTGFVTIAEGLGGLVVGTPTIDVLDATEPALYGLVFANVRADAGGFAFDATLAAPLNSASDTARMTLRANLQVDCDGMTQLVHAVTEIYFCSTYGRLSWASSGESCCVCRVIAEMAPSPIVPGAVEDDLPLAQALRLRIVELARISNTVILLAENDGGDGLEYEWLASTGHVERLAPDVVRWTLAEGLPDPLIQAAVSGSSAVAVASFAFNERAA